MPDRGRVHAAQRGAEVSQQSLGIDRGKELALAAGVARPQPVTDLEHRVELR
jgi:hypothetical protein